MTSYDPVFIVHGGAWDIPDDEVPGHLNGCRTAAQIGWSILADGGSALDAVEGAIAAIVGAANTGKIGDGKIFVTGLGDAIRIRTGEHGPDAV